MSVLHGDPYFPPLKPAGQMYAQVFQSSSQGGAESMHLMYLLSIAAATKTIDLAMAYFVPDEITSEALVSAMQARREGALDPAGPTSSTPISCATPRAPAGGHCCRLAR